MLYANGFIIGEDESKFRDVSEPKNAAFLKQLKAGEVPDELQASLRAQFGSNIAQVGINLVNRITETFTPPKPKFDFATSSG